MRKYQKNRVPARDEDVARKEEPKRERFLEQIGSQLGKLGSGGAAPPALLVPSPINPPGSSEFWRLLGRPGGQHGHGGTGSGQSAILSSTTHPTKGFVYFGAALSTAYDETNNRIGIGEAVPDAKLHIKIGASSSIYNVNSDISTYSAGTFGEVGQDKWGTNSDPSGLPSPFSTGYQNASTSDDYTSYLTADNNVAVTRICRMGLNGTLASGNSSWDVTLRMAKLSAAPPNGTLSVTVTDSAGVDFVQTFDPSVLTTGWVDYSISPINNGVGTNVPNSIRLSYASPGTGGGGNPTAYLLLTYITVGSENASDTLQKWEDPDGSDELSFAQDGGSGKDLVVSGTAAVRVDAGGGSSGLRLLTTSTNARLEAGTPSQTAMNLVLSGARAIQGTLLTLDFLTTYLTSLIRIAGGSPGVDKILAAIDTDGNAVWKTAAELGLAMQRTPVNSYAEATGIATTIETTVLTYVVAANMILQGFIASGSTNMRFKLKVNGTTKSTGRVSVADRTCRNIMPDSGIAVTSGQTITITAYHDEPANLGTQSAEASLLGYTES